MLPSKTSSLPNPPGTGELDGPGDGTPRPHAPRSRWAGLASIVDQTPSLRLFRFPVKAFYSVHLSVALVAGLGLSALVSIGGFNPVYLRAGDDVDVCWRLQGRGWRIGFASAAPPGVAGLGASSAPAEI